MKIADKLHKKLDDNHEAHRILLEFGAQWFLYGLIIGFILGVLIHHEKII